MTRQRSNTAQNLPRLSLQRIGILLLCWPVRIIVALPQLPLEISLRAGVLHAPPFATVETQEDGTLKFGGFQYDLLQRLKRFAAADSVELKFNLSEAPRQYESAFNMVANDCQESLAMNDSDSTLIEEQLDDGDDACDQLDMIIGNFYTTPDRGMRANLSPAWLRSTISTIKYTDKKREGRDYTTLTQVSSSNETICLKDGTFYADVVKAKFPRIRNYIMCVTQDKCIESLQAEECVLYADDELQLHARATSDHSLEVTREQFNTQYIVWPMRDTMDPIVTRLMDRWIYAATANATLDELYFQYFQQSLCPVGTAGDNCLLPCDPDHGQADVTGACVCESTRWTGDDCSIEIPENLNSIPASFKAMAYAMLGINVLVIVICGVWLYFYRYSAQVRYSQPFFLLLVLLGCLISSCTIIAMAQEDDGEKVSQACMAIPWLYSVGFSVSFGTLFAKILRVYFMFTQAAHQKTTGTVFHSNRRYYVTVQETICVIGVVLLIDVAILVAWTALAPLEWTRSVIRADQFGVPLESEGYCYSDHWAVFGGIIAAFHITLLAIACILCYKARGIPTKFSEGKYVFIAMLSHLQIMVVGVPILIILGTDSTSFFVRSAIVWMNDLMVVSLLFGNLIHSVYTTPASCNNASFVKREISAAVSLYNINSSLGSGSTRKQSPRVLAISEPPEDSSCSGNLDGSNRDTPTEYSATGEGPVNRRPLNNFSSITMNSSVSRKSVSWGMAYYSEGGDVESGGGVPIAIPLPENDNESKAVNASNRADRFCSQAIQGTPPKPYKRPMSTNSSPESSEEFQKGPILPSTVGEEQHGSSEMFTETESSAHSEIIDPWDSQAQPTRLDRTQASEGGDRLLGISRHTVETAQGAPKVPPRRSSGTLSLGSLGSMDMSDSEDEDQDDYNSVVPGLRMLSLGSSADMTKTSENSGDRIGREKQKNIPPAEASLESAVVEVPL